MFTFAPKKMFSLIFVATLAGLAGFAAGLLYERSRGAKALQTARAEAVAATARLEAERTHLAGEQQRAADALRVEFRAMAHDLAQTESGQLRRLHREQLEGLLAPLGEDIDRFRRQYAAGTAATEQHIKDLMEQTAAVSREAAELAHALRSQSKLQGDWGEVVLSNLLEASGLTPGRDFVVQARSRDAEGRELIPDVVVHLPGGRAVVVDSKVSLTAFTAYAASEDADERRTQLRAHIDSVRRHVSELSAKQYDKRVEGAIGYVLMFIPSEAAYIAAVENDRLLATDAYRGHVILLNPTNLLMALQLAYNLWQAELQSQSVREIYESAEKLYNKFVGFARNFTKVGEGIRRLETTYDEAFRQLATGNGNIVRQLEGWKKKGFNPSAKIPEELLAEAERRETIELKKPETEQ